MLSFDSIVGRVEDHKMAISGVLSGHCKLLNPMFRKIWIIHNISPDKTTLPGRACANRDIRFQGCGGSNLVIRSPSE